MTVLHIYVSTYCLHDLHNECRLTCKTCNAPCRCPHHDAPESQRGQSGERSTDEGRVG